MTKDENLVHFGGWCIESSPLILAYNLSTPERGELVHHQPLGKGRTAAFIVNTADKATDTDSDSLDQVPGQRAESAGREYRAGEVRSGARVSLAPVRQLAREACDPVPTQVVTTALRFSMTMTTR